MIYKSCILCNKDNYHILYPSRRKIEDREKAQYACTNINHRRFAQIVKCNQCGLVYINPQREDEKILDDYRKVVDKRYICEKEFRKLTFQRVLKLIKKYRSKGKILDIGCYIGTFLEVIRNEGWETFGIDLSTWAVDYAKQNLGLNVFQGTAEDGIKFATRFDVITLWDTIEHMTNPLYELRFVEMLLEDDGYLFLSTMNIDSYFARLLGRRWPWLMDMHLYYFTPRTIDLLLKKAGFKIIDITSYTHVISLNYLCYKISSYSMILSKAIKHIIDLSKITQLPISINFGDFMTVIAQKKQ